MLAVLPLFSPAFSRAQQPAAAATAFLHVVAVPMPGLAGMPSRKMAAAQVAFLSAEPVAFDGVTVVDVEGGKLVPDQRVVITGNRIAAVGGAGAITIPAGARVIDARGKYLIPGLWDMHHHTGTDQIYLLLVANGITGIRDAGSNIPLDTFARWRREILAGTRIGPPRQVLSGRFLNEQTGCPDGLTTHGVCITPGDTTAARGVVDSLRAAGANMIKLHDISSPAVWFAAAAEARRLGVPFGGHVGPITALIASDSGASILDHSGVPEQACAPPSGDLDKCRMLADRFRKNGTWWSPTCIGFMPCGAESVYHRFSELMEQFKSLAMVNPYISAGVGAGTGARTSVFQAALAADIAATDDSSRFMRLPEKAAFPILIGTDVLGYWPPSGDQIAGFALHAELAMDVAEGLTPLTVLRGATLNPAKFLHGTDSLGTVTPGKLADLVLLDGNPLADITSTTMIRAVVANGRYFDRAALDKLLADFQARLKRQPPAGAQP